VNKWLNIIKELVNEILVLSDFLKETKNRSLILCNDYSHWKNKQWIIVIGIQKK